MPETIATDLPSQVQDLRNCRFGKLVVISFDGVRNNATRWNVRCDCGREKTVRAGDLRAGYTKSCGCLASINRSNRFDYHGINPPKTKLNRSGKVFQAEQSSDVCAHIKDNLIYSPEDGSIRCRKTNALRLMSRRHGYFRVSISFSGSTVQMRAHRVGWFLYYGFWPVQIDHVNGDRADNRIVNLREPAGQSWNSANVSHRVDSVTKVKGVFAVKTKGPNKFRAQIMVNYKSIHLGMFKSKEAAALAYNKAALHYFGEFARLNVIGKSR